MVKPNTKDHAKRAVCSFKDLSTGETRYVDFTDTVDVLRSTTNTTNSQTKSIVEEVFVKDNSAMAVIIQGYRTKIPDVLIGSREFPSDVLSEEQYVQAVQNLKDLSKGFVDLNINGGSKAMLLVKGDKARARNALFAIFATRFVCERMLEFQKGNKIPANGTEEMVVTSPFALPSVAIRFLQELGIITKVADDKKPFPVYYIERQKQTPEYFSRIMIAVENHQPGVCVDGPDGNKE